MIQDLNYGQALEAVQKGKRAARKGWNGKGMFIFERPSDTLKVGFIVEKIKSIPQSVKDFFNSMDFSDEIEVKFCSYLCLYTADGSIANGWLPSQTDMSATDWCILD